MRAATPFPPESPLGYSTHPNQPKPGTVYLVGAGPGDPELITLRGLRVLRRATVIVYDRLVHPELLDEAHSDAERIYVGKRPGHHYRIQDQINSILVARAREGHVVVRLKGGDPFVFGRGGEECEVLHDAGVPFEVVPGISSAVSVPAYAGIPVTHRDVSTAFTVVTGHTCDPEANDVDWAALARVGTLVILMGLGRIRQITRRLIEGGRPAETPVAVISRGTTAHQDVVEGTLADIADRVAHVRPPATIVIGDVVSLRERIAWAAVAHSSDESEQVAAGALEIATI